MAYMPKVGEVCRFSDNIIKECQGTLSYPELLKDRHIIILKIKPAVAGGVSVIVNFRTENGNAIPGHPGPGGAVITDTNGYSLVKSGVPVFQPVVAVVGASKCSIDPFDVPIALPNVHYTPAELKAKNSDTKRSFCVQCSAPLKKVMDIGFGSGYQYCQKCEP